MKKVLTIVFIMLTYAAFAQKETYDLVTYTPPKARLPDGQGWKKEVTENITGYSIVNKKNNSWCQIRIVKSTNSKGSIEQDFESEWQELIVKNYKPTETPQLNEVQEADGWKIKAGGAKFTFNNSNAMAMLTTMSGFNRCVSIIATTNSQDYIKDIEALLSSVDLKKPETLPVGQAGNSQQTPANNNNNSSILGTWGKSASPNQKYDDYKRPYSIYNNGYSTDQYTFNNNGTYSYVSKTFRMTFDKILLVKENGSYQISGNNLTVNPKKSVIEAWSKKDGTDKWGKLLTTQNRTLEKVTYQFSKHYFSGIQLWNLVLQASKATERDGPFSGNATFSNAWYYAPISSNNIAIELPGEQQKTTEEVKKEPVKQTQ